MYFRSGKAGGGQSAAEGRGDITGKPGNISYMLQKDLLLPHKKVIDNVSLPLVIKGMKRKEASAKANPFFEQFGLQGTQEQYPAQLSGGMRQRAALLRTYLASTTGAALLDEPFQPWIPSPKARFTNGIWML